VIKHKAVEGAGPLVHYPQVQSQFIAEHISAIDAGMQIGIAQESPVFHGTCSQRRVGGMEQAPEESHVSTHIETTLSVYCLPVETGMLNSGPDSVVPVLPHIAQGHMNGQGGAQGITL